MYLHRFVIGIQFNRKMFRLPSVGGLAIDEILKICESERKLGYGYFNQVSTPQTKEGEYSISLIDEAKKNIISILPDQFVFKKSSVSLDSAVNIDKAIEEFQFLWRASNKVVDFPETRRLGLVGEYRIKEEKSGSAGSQLIQTLTKFPKNGDCGRFHLVFENKSQNSQGNLADKETDDFWNQINTFYISDIDETPEKGYINANIDIQRYFNPAKKDPLREINVVKEKYTASKNSFKNNLKSMGLTDL